MNDELFLEVWRFSNQEQIREHIKKCEGKHLQQVVYSSYHDALTQICFGCKKIRTTLYLKENKVKKE